MRSDAELRLATSADRSEPKKGRAPFGTRPSWSQGGSNRTAGAIRLSGGAAARIRLVAQGRDQDCGRRAASSRNSISCDRNISVVAFCDSARERCRSSDLAI